VGSIPTFPTTLLFFDIFDKLKKMETTIAFVLGMSVAAVTALVVVAIIGFVKAIKTEKALNEHIMSISTELDIKNKKIEENRKEIQIIMDHYERDIHDRIDSVLREQEKQIENLRRGMDGIISQMDSRFDKIITKIDKTKEAFIDNKIILKD
jgi:F0F1-type ATP synthase membrane subunit b/b'